MKTPLLIAITAGILVLQRIVELFIAAKNRKALLSLGAKEFGAEHYPFVVALHTAWLIAWPLESIFLRESQLTPYWPAVLSLILIAQILRYLAISTLGKYWNTRILVLPGAPKVRRGIYRYLKHPNYLAVIIEFAAVPSLFRAYLSALLFSIINLFFLFKIRIPTEERALSLAEEKTESNTN